MRNAAAASASRPPAASPRAAPTRATATSSSPASSPRAAPSRSPTSCPRSAKRRSGARRCPSILFFASRAARPARSPWTCSSTRAPALVCTGDGRRRRRSAFASSRPKACCTCARPIRCASKRAAFAGASYFAKARACSSPSPSPRTIRRCCLRSETGRWICSRARSRSGAPSPLAQSMTGPTAPRWCAARCSSSCSATRPPVRWWRRRPPRCQRRPKARSTGTTATAGCAIRR